MPNHEPPRVIQDYTDLSSTDITLLTSILSHAPKHSSSLRSMYEDVVRRRIAQLPSHLQNKLPWLAPACSLHRKVNSPVVASVFNTLKREIEVCIPWVWGPLYFRGSIREQHDDLLTKLEDLSGLWLKPEAFEAKYHRKQSTYEYQSNKCKACMLAQIGGKVDVVTALDAAVIGRVKPGMWKRSKRILWIEAWVRDLAEEGQEDSAVRKMWKLGEELREVRKDANVPDEELEDEVEVTSPVQETGSRASMVDRREDDVSKVDPFSDAIEADFLFENPRRPAPRPASPLIPPSRADRSRYGTQQPSSGTSVFSHETAAEDMFDSGSYADTPILSYNAATGEPFGLRFPNASSVYSRNTNADELFDEEQPLMSNQRPISPNFSTVESELIGMYQHSTVSDSYRNRATQVPRRNTEAATSRRQKDPELAKYPRYKLPPVTDPRGKLGIDANNASDISVVRKRKTIASRPALRVGKNGQVKGPFDPVSEASLVSHVKRSR